MTEFWNIIGGVVAFIFGQAVLQFVFQPIKEFNKERGDTSYLLLFHLPQITSAAKNLESHAALKEMGAALISTMTQIPFYSFFVWIRVFGLPSNKSILEASRELNGIVYSLHPCEQRGNSPDQNIKALEKIGRLLKIQTTFSENM